LTLKYQITEIIPAWPTAAQKFLTILLDISSFFQVFTFFFHFTSSRGIPNDALRNTGWETPRKDPEFPLLK
jgi:hypothetical protein